VPARARSFGATHRGDEFRAGLTHRSRGGYARDTVSGARAFPERGSRRDMSSSDACGVFISYSREDTAPQAGRLYDRLSDRIGEEHVFMDVGSIKLGVDFIDSLQDALSACDALLAVIGPAWAERSNNDGVRALDDPEDYVRLEIQTALDRAIPVIPVVINETPLPVSSTLPEPLKSLARRQGVRLRDATFRSDSSRLIDQVERMVASEPVGGTDRTADSSDKPIVEPVKWSAELIDKGRQRRVFRLRGGQRTHTVRYEHASEGSLFIDDNDPISNREAERPIRFNLAGFEARGAGSDVPCALWVDDNIFMAVSWISKIRLEVDGVVVYDK
jgi:hypothetical protein